MTTETTPIDRFVEIKRKINDLESELDQLKDDVLEAVKADGGKVEAEGFSIKSYSKMKYEFSDEYKAKNTELKQRKKAEIADGTAVVSGTSEYVVVRFEDD